MARSRSGGKKTDKKKVDKKKVDKKKTGKKKTGKGKASKKGIMGALDNLPQRGSGEFLKWKDDGKTIGWIHPGRGTGVEPREIHGAIPSKEDDDGEVRIRLRRYNCAAPGGDECPMCKLIDFAAELIDNEGQDPDTIILDGGKKGRGRWKLEDVAGRGTGNDAWQKNLSVTKEFVIPWVLPTEDRDPEHPVVIMTEKVSIARGIKRVVQEQMDERGEEKGDPLTGLWPFIFRFDKNESPSNMYTVARAGKKLAELDDETREILETDIDEFSVDMETLVRPGHPGDMFDTIGSCWAMDEYSFEDFREYVKGGEIGDASENDDEDEDDDLDDPADDDDPEDDENDDPEDDEDDDSEDDDGEDDDSEDDDEDDESSKKTSKKKADKKKAGKKSGRKVKCPDCQAKVIPDKNDRCPECRARLDSDTPF